MRFKHCYCNRHSYAEHTIYVRTFEIQGNIFVNGTPVEKVHDWYVANTGYVLQLAAPYYEELTVRENITLAAQMRLPKTLSITERLDRIETVMKEV